MLRHVTHATQGGLSVDFVETTNIISCVQGVWTPALNVAALLKTIQLLMNAPNPDDGLVVDIVRKTSCCCLLIRIFILSLYYTYID